MQGADSIQRDGAPVGLADSGVNRQPETARPSVTSGVLSFQGAAPLSSSHTPSPTSSPSQPPSAANLQKADAAEAQAKNAVAELKAARAALDENPADVTAQANFDAAKKRAQRAAGVNLYCQIHNVAPFTNVTDKSKVSAGMRLARQAFETSQAKAEDAEEGTVETITTFFEVIQGLENRIKDDHAANRPHVALTADEVKGIHSLIKAAREAVNTNWWLWAQALPPDNATSFEPYTETPLCRAGLSDGVNRAFAIDSMEKTAVAHINELGGKGP